MKYRLPASVAVLIALVGLTAWVGRNRSETRPDSQGETSIPDIDDSEITAVEITRPDENKVRLVKKEDVWRIELPLDAEANESAVQTALSKLGSLDIRGVAATRAQNHARLEVDESHAVQVKIERDNETVATLLLGAFRGGNTMVRAAGEDRVYNAKGSIKYAFNKDLDDWRNRRVVDLELQNITEVHFESQNGAYGFRRNGDDWEQLLGSDEHAVEKLASSKVEGHVRSLVSLSATGFAEPSLTVSNAGLEEPRAKAILVFTESDSTPDEDAAPDDSDLSEVQSTTGDATPPETEKITLLLGGTAEGEGRSYLQRQGNDLIYIVTQGIEEKMMPDEESFQMSEEGDEGSGPLNVAPNSPTGDIPPEILQQLQQMQTPGAGSP
ncbi:MAG: DUF4340 domain-containing protein [Myxococcota bacterium]